ncbi:MAG: hypothetical protein JWP81_3023 [Ferruginibacter sp.]|nr:hypothetical protein [Ferruginibacter sp.]
MKSNNSLIVRQSLFFNLLFAAIFLSIFVGVIITIRGQKIFDIPDYITFIALYLVPSIGAIYAGTRRTEVFRIDEGGIFYYKKLITSSDRFIQAYTEEVDPEQGFEVKFSLYIEYYRIETGIADSVEISLSPTLDKSVEEIQAAIEYFSSNKIQYDQPGNNI